MTATAYYSSPIGLLQLQSNSKAITSIRFIDDLDAKNATTTSDPILEIGKQQLEEYFNGNLRSFQFPTSQTGTDFQQKVWQLLDTIPYGKTKSYMDMARQYGDVKAIRAIAAANGKNDLAIVVPCHRVIGSNASLTGYAGGLWRKKWLLDHEAKFQSGVQQLAF